MRIGIMIVGLALSQYSCGSSTPRAAEPETEELAVDAREVHLSELRQLTRDIGENAEAYWSFDSSELIMQSKRPPFGCDQIFRLPVDGSTPTLVSTGLGRTTCSYFLPGDDEIVYSSTHQSGDECPPVPDHSQGYVWPIYEEYNIFVAKSDGSNLRKLTDTPHYDAEATVCGVDGSIIFTSTRNGDLDLYRMDRDGSNVVQLTDTPGYDGGAFFSSDCSQIVWRASRPTGDALSEYRELLGQGLVRPSKLEVFVAKADGSSARQITYLDAASFAPFFHPDGKRVLFSSNFAAEGGREFDIWAVNTDGSNLERITFAEGFDGFPMFSPDGKKLAFSSNRNQAKPGETDVYVATWVEEGQGKTHDTGADGFRADVAWLADDEREGRGVGTAGIEAAAEWLAQRFESLGLRPGIGESYFQSLEVTTAISRGDKSSLSIGRRTVDDGAFVPMGFSASATASARSVFVGYGIVAKELGIDDYEGKNVKGKVAVVRRYTPDTEVFKEKKNYDLYSKIHRKAFVARERGAVALVVINGPPPGRKQSEEAELPALKLEQLSAIGIPVVVIRSSFGGGLAIKSAKIRVMVDLDLVRKPSRNIVARLPAGHPQKLPGTLVVGAHYDHLGYGDQHSLGGGERAVHNGADDNASGVAGLLQVAGALAKKREELRRDIVFIAFTGEENGLLGSAHFVETMPKDLKITAMLNMDMIGRMRSNTLAVLGAATASEWPAVAEAACRRHGLSCRIGGDGYGPSDQTSFTGVGVPVLYFSTGPHTDYHKPSDDTEAINAIGGKTIADLVADIAATTSNMDKELSYQKIAAPVGMGDRRSFGASLGTIPDYSGDSSKPGMLLSGVRPGGAADTAGLKAGDRILAIGDTKLQSVQDLVYVLQGAKPGEKAVAKVERGGKILMLQLVYQKSTRRRH